MKNFNLGDVYHCDFLSIFNYKVCVGLSSSSSSTTTTTTTKETANPPKNRNDFFVKLLYDLLHPQGYWEF